jgi:dolichol-phosphate mannosyltransferase
MVSGSRYLKQYQGDSVPPAQRRFINQRITAELNERLGLSLTDGFCGFKAYRVESLRQLDITETGYAMPLELWVQAACAGWNIVELPVPLIYLDETRSFGGSLDNATTRLEHYHRVIERSIAREEARRQSPGLCRANRSHAACGKGAG